MAIEQQDTTATPQSPTIFILQPDEPHSIHPTGHAKRPSYGLLWALVVFGLFAGMALGFNRGQVSMYTQAQVDTQIAQAVHHASLQAYQSGVNTGYQQGIMAQTTQDGKLLAKTKADDAKILAHAKLVAYQSGQTDEQVILLNWWKDHCAFDTLINAYVCDRKP